MPISVIGNKSPVGSSGFTLLEIMLVLALMAIASLWVLPRFIGNDDGDVGTEARQLAAILRLASEEAQLTGLPVRCLVVGNGYRFFRSNRQGEWVAMKDAPFLPYRLATSNISLKVTIAGMSGMTGSDRRASTDDQIVFYPDGGVTLADIRIGNDVDSQSIRLRPGPGGIRRRP